MPRNRWLFLVFPLFLSLVFDRFFGAFSGFNQIGISFPIWVLLAITCFFVLIHLEGKRPSVSSVMLAVLSFLMAVMTAVRKEELTRVANMLASLAVLGLVFLTVKNNDWLKWGVIDYLRSIFMMMIAAISRPLLFIHSLSTETKNGSAPENNVNIKRLVFAILRGVLLALPILLLMSLLLMSADIVFADRMMGLFDLFDLHNLVKFTFRIVFIFLGLGYLLCGIFLHAIHPPEKEVGQKIRIEPFLGWVESAVVLSCVEVLFLFFVTIQFRYLFGGELNISGTGYTYSEYARRGFGELVSVSVLSLLLYWVLSVITRQDSDRKKKAFRILTIGLHVLVLAILVSAFQRLILYESGYGLTLLRAYTHVFIPWLGVLLVLAIALDFSKKRELFFSTILFVACGFVLSLGAVNIERFIVRQNIQRTALVSDFDIDYLRSLTVDAVPEIIRQYHAGDIPEDVRILLGVELVCRTERADLVNSRWVPRTYAFLKYNIADKQAYRQLQETKIELEEFTVSWDGISEQWGVMYQNEFYECAPYMIQRYAGKP